MILTEQHIISPNHYLWKQCNNLCFLSKNLYNATLYKIKQHYKETAKFLRYNHIANDFAKNNNLDFRALPAATSQQILMVFDQNIKSYFILLKKWKKNKTSLNGCPKFLKYKDKVKGRNVVIFTTTQIRLKNGWIILPKKVNLAIKTKIINLKLIKQVRIIPKSGNYVIEVVYEKEEKQPINNDNYLSIDLGVNNLATCFNSLTQTSIIINGKPLKSTNQYYNKKKVCIQSNLENNHKKKTSKRLTRLTQKRNNKIKNYLHKSSRIIVNYCISNNISNVIIGLNKEWKQKINLGKKNNQNFVHTPFNMLINQIMYKGKLEGIDVKTTEESYTSKCSALDLELLKKHEIYMGKRTKRGLYVSTNGIKINADLNGAINILRKETGDKWVNTKTLTSRGQVVWPIKVNLNKL